jgi:hypothetical protein
MPNNNDPLNLGDPTKDAWARMVAPNRDVTGGSDENDTGKGRKTYLPVGATPAFIWPMGVQGGSPLRQVDAQPSPKAIFPQHTGYFRSSDAIGSYYHKALAPVTSSQLKPMSFAERFVKQNERSDWQQRLGQMQSDPVLARRWVGGPPVTPPGQRRR